MHDLFSRINRYIIGSLPTHRRLGGEADRQDLLNQVNSIHSLWWSAWLLMWEAIGANNYIVYLNETESIQ